MAKRQNFVVGSTNSITQTLTSSELNHAFDQYEILTAEELDGVFNAVSDYSNDSSNEIANAIQSITGSQPTGATQTELAGALNQLRQDIETSSLTFKGYIATSAPSSSTYGLVEGNLWINSATLPTSFPVAATNIKEWNGTAWVTQSNAYTAADFDFWRNVNDNEGYYWFGGQWVVMSTDMSTTYFTLNQTSGKWEIKTNVNLPGKPTAATPTSTAGDTQIANVKYVQDMLKALEPDLFDYKWTDHLLNGSRWILASNFDWYDGIEDYPDAFDYLYAQTAKSMGWRSNTSPATLCFTANRKVAVGDAIYTDSDLTTQSATVASYDESAGTLTSSLGATYEAWSLQPKSVQTETIAGTTITYYLADNGMKVVSGSAGISQVETIYAATGVAWYYIIDAITQKFKLPRIDPEKEKLLGSTVPVYTTATQNPENSNETTATWRKAGTTHGVIAGLRLATETSSGTQVETSGVGGTSTSSVTISNMQADLSGATSYYAGKKYLYFYPY